MAIVLYALTALLYCGLAFHGWATRNPRLAAAGGAPAGHPGRPGASATAVLMPPAAPAGGRADGQPAWWHALVMAALVSHGVLLHETIFGGPADVRFAFALSAMLWLGVGIYWIESFSSRWPAWADRVSGGDAGQPDSAGVSGRRSRLRGAAAVQAAFRDRQRGLRAVHAGGVLRS
jgi:hypothetical protein